MERSIVATRDGIRALKHGYASVLKDELRVRANDLDDEMRKKEKSIKNTRDARTYVDVMLIRIAEIKRGIGMLRATNKLMSGLYQQLANDYEVRERIARKLPNYDGAIIPGAFTLVRFFNVRPEISFEPLFSGEEMDQLATSSKKTKDEFFDYRWKLFMERNDAKFWAKVKEEEEVVLTAEVATYDLTEDHLLHKKVDRKYSKVFGHFIAIKINNKDGVVEIYDPSEASTGELLYEGAIEIAAELMYWYADTHYSSAPKAKAREACKAIVFPSETPSGDKRLFLNEKALEAHEAEVAHRGRRRGGGVGGEIHPLSFEWWSPERACQRRGDVQCQTWALLLAHDLLTGRLTLKDDYEAPSTRDMVNFVRRVALPTMKKYVHEQEFYQVKPDMWDTLLDWTGEVVDDELGGTSMFEF